MASKSNAEGHPVPDPVDEILDKLTSLRGAHPGKLADLTQAEIKMVLLRSREILMQQPMLLELSAPLKIVGDVHGQFSDMLRLFEYGGFPPESNYLFLGDYVDRGKQSIECAVCALAYKIKYPENFFLLRGNHECASINRIYGFYDECKRRYSIKLWKMFTDVFNCLPAAAVIDDKVLCVHGGLSPELTSLDQIQNISRPTDVPDTGLLCDIIWSDPGEGVDGWGYNDRGVSFTYGEDVVKQFLRKHELDLIVRAHQVVEDGYEVRLWLHTIFNYYIEARSLDRCSLHTITVLRRKGTRHGVLGAKLLWRIRQRSRHDVGRRDAHVQLSNPQARRWQKNSF